MQSISAAVRVLQSGWTATFPQAPALRWGHVVSWLCSQGSVSQAATRDAHAFSSRQKSNSYATSSESGSPVIDGAKQVGAGFGFRSRFKDMDSDELKSLIKRTGRPERQRVGRKKLPKPVPGFHAGQFAQQWHKLPECITAPYTAQEITGKDIFAVIEAGHTQFKVVADDKIFVNKLIGADVNDVIQFNRVLLAGTPSDTLVGRPFIPGMTVTAAVEEHIRDAPVYIYKHRRAKGYRRFRGFRAELTGLRILEIKGSERHGVEVPAWDEQASTPLRKAATLGARVRKARKMQRQAERRQAPVTAGDLASMRELMGTSSSPVADVDVSGADQARLAAPSDTATATPKDAEGSTDTEAPANPVLEQPGTAKS